MMEFKPNLLLYLLYFAEAWTEFVGSIFASLRPGSTAPFEEMLLRWRAFGNTVSILTGLRFKPLAPQTNVLPLDQLAGFKMELVHDIPFQFYICVVALKKVTFCFCSEFDPEDELYEYQVNSEIQPRYASVIRNDQWSVKDQSAVCMIKDDVIEVSCPSTDEEVEVRAKRVSTIFENSLMTTE